MEGSDLSRRESLGPAAARGAVSGLPPTLNPKPSTLNPSFGRFQVQFFFFFLGGGGRISLDLAEPLAGVPSGPPASSGHTRFFCSCALLERCALRAPTAMPRVSRPSGAST